MVEYHTVSAKDQSRLHQFGVKVLPGFFLDDVLFAERIWKGDIMVADIEELEEMDASELQARRLNAKEVLTPQRSVNFMFPVSDGTIKNLWERTASEKIHLNPGVHGTRRRTKKFSRKVRGIRFSHPTSRRLDAR